MNATLQVFFTLNDFVILGSFIIAQLGHSRLAEGAANQLHLGKGYPLDALKRICLKKKLLVLLFLRLIFPLSVTLASNCLTLLGTGFLVLLFVCVSLTVSHSLSLCCFSFFFFVFFFGLRKFEIFLSLFN